MTTIGSEKWYVFNYNISYQCMSYVLIAAFALVISSCRNSDLPNEDAITYTPILDSIPAKIVPQSQLKPPVQVKLNEPEISYLKNPIRHEKIKKNTVKFSNQPFSFSLVNKITLNKANGQYPVPTKITAKPVLAKQPRKKKVNPALFDEKGDALILDKDDGLPNNNNAGLFQDNEGAIWGCSRYIGAWKYDGSHFYYFDELMGLPDYSVINMLFDSEGDVWFGLSIGLVKYDGKTFTNYSEDKQISNLKPTKLIEDEHGNIWIGSEEGIYKLDKKANTITHFNKENGLLRDQVNGLFYDNEGKLWAFYNNLGFSLITMEKEGHEAEYQITNFTADDPSKFHKVQSIHQDDRGQIIIGNDIEFVLIQNHAIDNQSLKAIQYKIEGVVNFIYSMAEDKMGTIFCSTQSGIYQLLMDAKGEITQVSRFMPDVLVDNWYTALIIDKENYLWTSLFFDHTVVRINLSSPLRNISADYEVYAYVISMTEDLSNDLWYTGSNGSLYCLMYPNEPEKEYLLEYPKALQKFLGFEYKSMLDERGNICFFNGADLIKYELDKQKNEILKKKYVLSDILEVYSFSDMLIDKSGAIWLVSNTISGSEKILNSTGGGVYKIKDDQVTVFGIEQGLLNSNTHTFCLDVDGNFWFNNTFFGMTKYEPESNGGLGRWIHFQDKLKLQRFFNMIEDPNEGVYIQSIMGLMHFPALVDTPYQKVYRYATGQNGLQSNNISQMLYDDYNNIWVNNEEGLDKIHKLDPKNPAAKVSIENYDKADGFPDIKTLNKVIKDDVFFIGSFNVYAMGIEEMNVKSKPVEVNLKAVNLLSNDNINNSQSININNNSRNEIDLSSSEIASKKLALSYLNNYLEFEYNIVEVNKPHKVEYRYYLDGQERTWNQPTKSTTVTYPNLSHGEYELKVQGRIMPAEWSETMSYPFKIRPPWWHSWWAYTLYFIGFVLMLFYLFKYLQDQKLAKVEAIRLKELDVLKTKLYTNITHEFRTPLTVISGMTTQMKNDPEQWFDTGVDMIQRNSKRLLGLVNQMLDLSKLESGKIALRNEQSDIIVYLQYLVENVHSLAESKGLIVHFHSDEQAVLMDFDPEKLQQIITNLLSNAVKFTPRGGHIYMFVRKVKLDGNFLQIKLKDTGIGIPENELGAIFDRFYQIDDSATRSSEGSGIGLALTKDLVVIMDGKISVTSQVGKETEFKLLLPISNLAPMGKATFGNKLKLDTQADRTLNVESQKEEKLINSTQEQNIIRHSSSKPQILIIEDNPDIVAYIAACLDQLYSIMVGKNGQEGVEIAKESVPDLIITDVMMPIMDGFEVCETLKLNEHTSHIPIIMLTAKSDMESKLEGLLKGADAYLAKPFHKEELLIRIKSLLGNRKMLQKYYLSLALDGSNESSNDMPAGDTTENEFILKIREVLNANFDKYDFNVDKLSILMGMSHSSLSRKMNALTGVSPVKYIRSTRMSKAKQMLIKSDETISTIALNVGFEDPGYFSRLFKKEFGMTPNVFRKNSQVK